MADTGAGESPEQSRPPIGHSRAGHAAHGWCSLCPGREPWEELLAWRVRHNEATDEATTPDKALAESREVVRHDNR